MPKRLGIDIGSNSLGWWLLRLDGNGEPVESLDGGVMVFPSGRDPQSGTSLAVDRRVARGMRRRRDRFLRRRSDLMSALVDQGLMPATPSERKALESLDPYALRARGLDEALTPHELGRALFHLHQRRGFKSNRKTDKAADKEAGKIKEGARKLREAMAANKVRTLGEFLARRHAERRSVRARLTGQGKDAGYEFYPQRALVEEEFDALWNKQAELNPALTDSAREAIKTVFFRQRPLRPVDPGKCTLNPDDPRAPRALPLTQRFRMLQETANLRIGRPGLGERPITKAEQARLVERLSRSREVPFTTLHKLLKLAPEESFNLESERRKKLKGDETAAALAHKDRFAKAWHDLPFERRNEIVERLLEEENEAALVAWLQEHCGLSEAQAEASTTAPLPEGYGRLGRPALETLVSVLEEESKDLQDAETGEVLTVPLTYDEAVQRAGYPHHSDFRPAKLRARLPYYGALLERYVSGTGEPSDRQEVRLGRLANPTVHIGLNQLRKLVNAVIKNHGPPDEIVVELTRELKVSQDEKRRIDQQQMENQRKNDERRATLLDFGMPDSGENRLRLRLWEELNPAEPHSRRCVYTGEPIGLNTLFSDAVDIDHILPFSKTLDNSPANKIVALRSANRAKGNRTPHEAFHDGSIGDWNGIVARAEKLPSNKTWRFQPDAMERFKGEKGFLDRQLTDTAYLARLTREYLRHVCPQVWVTPGRLTAMLRGKWGLDGLLPGHNIAPPEDPQGEPEDQGRRRGGKRRSDHRHHAIDAFVMAMTSRSLLQRIARENDEARERVLIPELSPALRTGLRDGLARLVVHHRPDHGKAGKLHEETAYGLVRDPEAEEGHNLVYRKPLLSLNENEIARIRDRDLRHALEEHVHIAKTNGLKLAEALADFDKAWDQRIKAREDRNNVRKQRDNDEEDRNVNPIRRVRLLKKEQDVIAIADAAGRAYKAYSPGDNHCIEIYAGPGGRWQGEAITVFQANQSGYRPAWRQAEPEAQEIMRVHKGDLLMMDDGGEERVMRVVRLNAKAGRLYLAPHNETGDLQKRHEDPNDLFRWRLISYGRLQELKARPVRVDVMGRLHDPGPFS